jgi:hypothetical protein
MRTIDSQSRTAGIFSLALGMLSVLPFGALAGIPAVLLGIHALRNEPRSRGMARAGAVLGGIGIAMTIAMVLWFSLIMRTARLASASFAATDPTLSGMYVIQSSLEEWAMEHGGAYPYQAEFHSDSSPFMEFLARDREG